jgi:hypothetical protein
MERSTFWKGIAVLLVGVILIGAVISRLNAGHHRPEGAAERWLAALSDTGRKGVHVDALKRTDKIGPASLGTPLINGIDTDGKHGSFPDLEVGRAVRAPLRSLPGFGASAPVRVPFRLHQYRDSGTEPEVHGALTLERIGDEWHVTGMSPGARPGEKVPSEGGDRPSRGSFGLWALALALGFAMALGASTLVRWAERSATAAGAAPEAA